MAHIVTERCVNCRYTDCCVVCPVECFYEITNPAMLVIDPDTCIDCGLCVPECPIQAIWPADELPDAYKDWTDKNAELFGGGVRIKVKKDALAGALGLAALQTRENERGWTINEPSGAKSPGDGGHSAPATAEPVVVDSSIAVPPGLSEAEANIYRAAASGKYKWRTVRGVAAQLKLPQTTIQADMDKLVSKGVLRKQEPKTKGLAAYAVAG